jgi:hypothetical protein
MKPKRSCPEENVYNYSYIGKVQIGVISYHYFQACLHMKLVYRGSYFNLSFDIPENTKRGLEGEISTKRFVGLTLLTIIFC